MIDRLIKGWALFSIALALIAIAFFLPANNEDAVMPWPGKTIRLYDSSGRPSSLRRAVASWNATGLDFRIRLVDSRQQADVVVEGVDKFSSMCPSKKIVGCASIGNQPQWPWQKPTFELKKKEPGAKDNFEFSGVAAHEIGHLLGLRHNRGKCTLMNSLANCREQAGEYALDGDCPLLRDAPVLQTRDWCPGRYREAVMCGPSIGEIKQLINRYGGQLNRNYRPFCYRQKTIHWRGWCLYPNWRPQGQGRPGWIAGRGPRARCRERAPAKYLAALFIAIGDIRKERQQILLNLNHKAVEQGDLSVDQNTEISLEILARAEERLRLRVPPRLRPLLAKEKLAALRQLRHD